MKIIKTYTHNAFIQKIELLKAEGHIFLGCTWDHACFKDIVVERCY